MTSHIPGNGDGKWAGSEAGPLLCSGRTVCRGRRDAHDCRDAGGRATQEQLPRSGACSGRTVCHGSQSHTI